MTLTTATLFFIVYNLVLAERIFELFLSHRNVGRARARGGVVVAADPFGLMVITHFLFMLAAPLEVWLLPGLASPALAWTMTAVVVACMALRYWAVLTLGDRWNARVVCIPGLPAIHSGPYRWVRHPNYVAVALELIALPLIGGAWRTAAVFGILNLLVLRRRIRVEEKALAEYADYDQHFARRPRFIPGGGSPRKS